MNDGVPWRDGWCFYRTVVMTTAKSTAMAEINDIQRRMAQIRHELHIEVQETVRGVQSLTDWRGVVRSHPWVSLGVAAIVGYFIVPKRHVKSPTIVAVSPAVPELSPAVELGREKGRRRGSSWSIAGTVFSLLAPVAVRAAQNSAVQYLEQWLARQPSGPAGPDSGGRRAVGPRPAAPVGPAGRPGDPRD
jgi:hypothetical protein